jgi:hypothetical protein
MSTILRLRRDYGNVGEAVKRHHDDSKSSPKRAAISPNVVDLRGARLGRFTVPGDARPTIRNGQAHWPVICECGARKLVRQDNLRSGRVVSCSCRRADPAVRKAASAKMRAPKAETGRSPDPFAEGLAEGPPPIAPRLEDLVGPGTFDSQRGISKKSAFLQVYVATAGSLTRAAAAVGIHRTTHYHWCKQDPEYRQAFETARERATQALMDEGLRRAFEGVRKGVYYRGKLVGSKVVYSDAIWLAMMKQLKPAEYDRPRKQDRTTQAASAGPFPNSELRQKSDEQLRGVIRILDNHIAQVRAIFKGPG